MPTSIFDSGATLPWHSEAKEISAQSRLRNRRSLPPIRARRLRLLYYVVLFARLHVRLIRRRSNRNRFPARTVTKRARVRMAIFLEPGAASGLA